MGKFSSWRVVGLLGAEQSPPTNIPAVQSGSGSASPPPGPTQGPAWRRGIQLGFGEKHLES